MLWHSGTLGTLATNLRPFPEILFWLKFSPSIPPDSIRLLKICTENFENFENFENSQPQGHDYFSIFSLFSCHVFFSFLDHLGSFWTNPAWPLSLCRYLKIVFGSFSYLFSSGIDSFSIFWKWNAFLSLDIDNILRCETLLQRGYLRVYYQVVYLK